MKSVAPDAYRANLTALATAAFAKHAIREHGDRRWLVQEPYTQPSGGAGWSSHYAAEVFVGWEGSILVHGDIDLVVFTRHGGFTDPRAVLRWMGNQTDVDSYAAGKAVIGTGHELAQTVDDGVARWELERHRTECAQDHARGADADPAECPHCRAYTAGIRLLDEGENVREMQRILYEGTYDEAEPGDEGLDSETAFRIGEVTAPRVFYAHAAVRRLCALLDAAA